MADEEKKKNTIFVVEDDAEMLDLYQDVLRGQGYEVVPIRRGRNLVKLVKDEKPGAVILDIALADADGTQVLKQLKDDWDAKKVPVIVVSAYTARLDHTGRSQVAAVFTKPFEVEPFVASVREAMTKKED